MQIKISDFDRFSQEIFQSLFNSWYVFVFSSELLVNLLSEGTTIAFLASTTLTLNSDETLNKNPCIKYNQSYKVDYMTTIAIFQPHLFFFH